MKNFKAIIQVAEDAEFRKTVLDAIKSETQSQLKVFLKSSMDSVVKEFIENNREYILGLARSRLIELIDKNIILSDEYQILKDESYEEIKNKFNTVIDNERFERIILQQLEKYMKKKFTGA